MTETMSQIRVFDIGRLGRRADVQRAGRREVQRPNRPTFAPAMQRALLACALSLTCVLAAAQQKIGHVNTGLVLEALPETAAADSLLQVYQDSLSAGGQALQTAFEAKYRELLSDSLAAERTPKQTQALQQELQEMQQEMQTFQQVAAQAFEQRRGQYLTPIVTRVADAIKAYAKANGYSLVVDASVPQALLFVDEENDLTPVIIAELTGV